MKRKKLKTTKPVGGTVSYSYENFQNLKKKYRNNKNKEVDFIPGFFNPLTDRKRIENVSGNRSRAKRRQTRERALYGVTRSDLWNFGPSHLLPILVAVLRSLPQTNDVKELQKYTAILADHSSENSWDYYTNKNKMDKYYQQKMVEMKNEAKIVKNNWAFLYMKVFFTNFEHGINVEDYISDVKLIEMFDTLPSITWKQWRGLFTDPTQKYFDELKNAVDKNVYRKTLHKHYYQRSKFGYSDIDLTYSGLSYIHWLMVIGLVYLSSGDTMVVPNPRYLPYAKGFLTSLVENKDVVSKDDDELMITAFDEFPEYVLRMWD